MLGEFCFELRYHLLDRLRLGNSPCGQLTASVAKQLAPVHQCIRVDGVPPQSARASNGGDKIVVDAAVQLHPPTLAEPKRL
jgi:hypothetical protein